jgi:hypothetical protein
VLSGEAKNTNVIVFYIFLSPLGYNKEKKRKKIWHGNLLTLRVPGEGYYTPFDHSIR